MDSVDWGTVSAIGALVAASFGYTARQIHRVEDKLTNRIDRVESGLRTDIGQLESSLRAHIGQVETVLRADIGQLTERYITHLERHPH